MRHRLLALLVLALPVALAAPASALEPTRETVTVHRVLNPFFTCPGFTVTGVFDITREITTFYDNDGTPVSRLLRNDITGTVINNETGHSLPSDGVRIFHIDLTTGAGFTTGSNGITKLPDGGTAVPGAGRLVFDANGQLIEHLGTDDSTEMAQLCAALGG